MTNPSIQLSHYCFSGRCYCRFYVLFFEFLSHGRCRDQASFHHNFDRYTVVGVVVFLALLFDVVVFSPSKPDVRPCFKTYLVCKPFATNIRRGCRGGGGWVAADADEDGSTRSRGNSGSGGSSRYRSHVVKCKPAPARAMVQ